MKRPLLKAGYHWDSVTQTIVPARVLASINAKRNAVKRRRRQIRIVKGGEGTITFLMSPGACPDDPAEEKLLREHEAEADRHGAEFWNYGAFLEHHALSSKTSNGYLYSKIDPAEMKVTHYWD